MKKICTAIAALGLTTAFGAAPAMADDWSVSVMGLGVSTDSARLQDAGAEDGTGFEVIGQNAVSEKSGYQLVYSGWDIDVNATGSKGIDAFSVNYLYGKLAGEAQVYLIAGAGFSVVDTNGGGKDTHAHVNLGVGGQVSFSEKWAVASEAKWRRTDDDTSVAAENEYDDWSLGLGVNYRF